MQHQDMQDEQRSGNSIVRGIIDFAAGSLGGTALVMVSQPLDTVKVKMQTYPHLYKNMMTCLIKTFKKDGLVRGLYAGTTPAIVANVAENSVLFAAFGACQKMVASAEGTKDINNLSPLSNATAGFFAGFLPAFTLCPTELVKCKLQALRESGRSKVGTTPYQLMKQIYRQEGIRGFYYGLTASIAREMFGYFFFFGSYDIARQLMAKENQAKTDIGVIKTLIAGGFAGICFWVSIFPVDVIKSRIQVDSIRTNMFRVGLDVAQKEGIGALYSGMLVGVFRTIPAASVLFVTVEYSKKLLLYIFNMDQ